MTIKPSSIALVLANLVPLAGVVWLDWRVFDVLMLYWAENVVIGLVNVMRMIASRSGPLVPGLNEDAVSLQLTETQRTTLSRVSKASRLFIIPFFIVHYGMFCFGHYTAVVSLFSDEVTTAGSRGIFFGSSVADVWQSPLWIGVVAIAISHLISFVFNFIGSGEYQRTSLSQLMRRPYGRIIALHITVIAGGFFVTVLGNPLWALLVLIVMKSAFDLRMHEKERQLFGLSAA